MRKTLLLSIALFLIGLNSFSQWVVQPSGTSVSLKSVYFPHADTGYIVGDNGMILYTTNAGNLWTQQSSGTNNNLVSVYFPAANTGYTSGDSGTILKTVNGGTNWITQVGGTTANLLSVGFFNADTGYAIGYDSLLKTTNGGETWTVKPTSGHGGFPIGGGSGFFTDANIGYQVRYESVFGTHGIISKTVDGGNNWWDYWVTIPVLGVYFPDDTTGYVIGGRYYIDGSSANIILKTTNRGGTWTEQSAPTNIPLLSVFFTDANTGYAIGDSGTILKTTNGGILWTLQTSGTFNHLLSVYFTDTNTGYVVGEGGIILKTSNGGITGVNDQIWTSNSLKIYPNPAEEKIIIEPTESGSNMNGTISIYGMTGQELIKQQAHGSNLVLNVSSLPQGVYFIRLTGSNKTGFGKFIKE